MDLDQGEMKMRADPTAKLGSQRTHNVRKEAKARCGSSQSTARLGACLLSNAG